MSDKLSTSAAENAAGASSNTTSSSNAGSTGAAPKKPLPEQNPAFRMMGTPTADPPYSSDGWEPSSSFTGTILYDKWQTRRMREKWCNLVSHIAEEPLDTKTTPRKVTIYLSAPPGDGLRFAREHFHNYVKPILVSAAMDWDVVEGRKEGDVRHKTAERIRKRRKRNGEGEPLSSEDENDYTVESIRQQNGDKDYPGVSGDIVIGRNTWKEYIRGIHEGYLGPPDLPKSLDPEVPPEGPEKEQSPNVSLIRHIVDDANKPVLTEPNSDGASPQVPEQSPVEDTPEKIVEDKKKEEEKPKRRFPPSYITPDEYQAAAASPSTPEILGPSVGVRMPHLLGIRNTPTRMYRFLTRRRLQDDVGRQVAAAVLASHRPYGTVAAVDEESQSSGHAEVAEQKEVLAVEERDWWKKVVDRPREEHEESVWIEPIALDERITSRMRAFELTSEDEERAKKIEAGGQKRETPQED